MKTAAKWLLVDWTATQTAGTPPTWAELRDVATGDVVMVCVRDPEAGMWSELPRREWLSVAVTAAAFPLFEGTVCCSPLNSRLHGVGRGALLRFKACNVMALTPLRRWRRRE